MSRFNVKRTAFTYALNLLVYKDYTEQEIRRKMTSRFDSEEINSAIEKLKDMNYINTDRYVRQYTLSRYRRGYGVNYVREKLKQKGLVYSNQELNSYLEESENDPFNVAYSFALKYMEKKKTNVYNKISSYLQRRGYPSEIVYQVMDQLKKEKLI